MSKNLVFILIFSLITGFSVQAKEAKSSKNDLHKILEREQKVSLPTKDELSQSSLRELALLKKTEDSDDKLNYATKGNYIGFDIINSKLRFSEYYKLNKTNGLYIDTQPSYYNNSVGFGAGYKYAFNFDGIFIAPGVFVEHNDATAYGSGSINYLQRMRVKNRAGFKADIGYDVSSRFSPYFTFGYSWIDYQTRSSTGIGGKQYSKVYSNGLWDWYYGAGFMVNCTKNLSLNFEYNYQRFKAMNDVITNNKGYESFYKTRLDVAKVGIYYKF